MTLSGKRQRELQRLADNLSQRDWRILDDLGRVRLLTGRHIQRLHVANDSPLTQARRTRSILQRLFDLGLVSRLERQVGGIRAGSAGYTYALSTTGQRLITGRGPAGGNRLRRYWEPSAAFVDHVLAVSNLYVQLRESERTEAIQILRFDAEPASWRRWRSISGELMVLRPDAFIVTATQESETFIFLELDRSTESLPVIRRKAEIYGSYWMSGREQEKSAVFPRVVFVVPDERRKAGVVQALSKVDPSSWQLFQVVTNKGALAAVSDRSPPHGEGGQSHASAM